MAERAAYAFICCMPRHAKAVAGCYDARMEEPDLNLLIALDALLAEGSVVGAARRLGLSASAMSRTLARLREATGDPLLVRAGRSMMPTPHAEALRERAHNACYEARTLLRPSVVEPDFRSLQRTFTLRTNDDFVEAFGAALIAAVAASAPLVCLRFAPKAEKTGRYLREGAADLEIGVLGEMGPEVRVQALFRDRFIGVARSGHPLQAAAEISAERYAAFGHVVATRRGRSHGPVDDALAALGLQRRVAAMVPGFSAVLALARASDLLGLVPASVMTRASVHGLFTFGLPVQTDKITVSQMWHPRLDADPVHRWLRQRVLAVCRPADDLAF